jgi:hypothetical protein
MPNAQTAICIAADYKIQTTMGPLDLLNHLFNFALPAMVVGVLLAYCAPLLYKKQAPALAGYAQAAINSVAGVAALTLGLWFFGRDGKMASYAAMAVTCALSQAFAMRR